METLRCLPSPSAVCAGPRSGVIAFRRGDAQRQRASYWGSHCEIPRAAHSLWALSRSHCRATGRGLGWQLRPPSCTAAVQDGLRTLPRPCVGKGHGSGCPLLQGRDARLGWGRPVGAHPATPTCTGLKSRRQRPERNVLLKCSRDHPHSSSRRHRCSADTS